MAIGVGVDDDVRAGLGDRETDVGEGLLIDREHLAERSEGVAYDCDIRGSCRERQLHVRHRRGRHHPDSWGP